MATDDDICPEDLTVGLSQEAVELVVRIAHAVSKKITEDLQNVSDLLRRSTPLPEPMVPISHRRAVEREKENEDRLDRLYARHVAIQLNELGGRQIIRANIGQTKGIVIQ
jgi:hypothetical protein